MREPPLPRSRSIPIRRRTPDSLRKERNRLYPRRKWLPVRQVLYKAPKKSSKKWNRLTICAFGGKLLPADSTEAEGQVQQCLRFLPVA